MTIQEITGDSPHVYDIPVDPVTGIARKVWVYGHSFNERTRVVVMDAVVLPLNAEGHVLQTRTIKPYDRQMIADDSRFVNPENGMLVVQGSPGWVDLEGNIVENPVPQFAFFWALLPNPIIVSMLYQQAVSMGAAENAFD